MNKVETIVIQILNKEFSVPTHRPEIKLWMKYFFNLFPMVKWIIYSSEAEYQSLFKIACYPGEVKELLRCAAILETQECTWHHIGHCSLQENSQPCNIMKTLLLLLLLPMSAVEQYSWHTQHVGHYSRTHMPCILCPVFITLPLWTCEINHHLPTLLHSLHHPWS